MNKRMLELAGEVCDTLHDGDWNIPNEFIEKFAELIVKECALIAGLMEHEGRKNIGATILDRFEVKE